MTIVQCVIGIDEDNSEFSIKKTLTVFPSIMSCTVVQKFDSSEAETTEDENVAIKSARNSFSQAIKGNYLVHFV